MSETSLRLTRRAVLIGALATPAAAWATVGGRKVVTILGDSITAGFGLPAAQALPAQLQLALKKLGKSVIVRGAGVTGDTTGAGLARVGFSVQADTDVCLIALGGNDVLQGWSPETTKANLEAIVEKLKARKIRVVLTGLSAPGDLGGDFAREFSAVFPAVARAEKVPLYPNLLEGVLLDSRYNQADGIHPNAAGVKIIAARLAPVVAKALR
jgi:acyl-CoA thioesterase-1